MASGELGELTRPQSVPVSAAQVEPRNTTWPRRSVARFRRGGGRDLGGAAAPGRSRRPDLRPERRLPFTARSLDFFESLIEEIKKRDTSEQSFASLHRVFFELLL